MFCFCYQYSGEELDIIVCVFTVVFQVYDTDRDGQISRDDLQHVSMLLVGLGFKLSVNDHTVIYCKIG